MGWIHIDCSDGRLFVGNVCRCEMALQPWERSRDTRSRWNLMPSFDSENIFGASGIQNR